ncbi:MULTISPECIES: glycosyltransferase [unclassified Pseudomonas]|uniref:glycosyltransferase n=1 Tax=unclassified Pseudomonas TaxID=196821 RepID=UPI00159FA69A|nr:MULTISPECIES: glycosyltransferase [unclassified Pseudomonas]NWC95263.1 glycosyltransferase [Pseudomonas sp. IPO3779]NWD17137.1 glycosyltransferase [Pseudomonas sp. IPO3778]
MPTYNAEQYVAAALDSILIQDYEHLQVIACDDASQDRTGDIIRDYSLRFPGKIIAIVNETNLGVTLNCNKALSFCEGEYVSLFAGDDIMLPGKISKQVSLMDSCPDVVLSYHPVEIFDSETDKTMFITNQHPREDVHSTADLLLKGGIPGGCSIMIRRDSLPEGNYDSRLKTVSDWLLFLEVSLRGRVLKIDEVLGRYRKHAGGASMQTYGLLSESLLALDLFLEKIPQDSELRPLVKSAKARYVVGESYRQLRDDPTLALSLAKRALTYNGGGFAYTGMYIFAWLNRYLPGVNFLFCLLGTRLKYLVKRVIG